MEQTECSEISAYKIQTPGNYPEESIQCLLFTTFIILRNICSIIHILSRKLCNVTSMDLRCLHMHWILKFFLALSIQIVVSGLWPCTLRVVDTIHNATCLFSIKQNGVKAESDFIQTIRRLISINSMMTFSDKHRITIFTFIYRMRSLIYVGQLPLLICAGWQALYMLDQQSYFYKLTTFSLQTLRT